MDKKAKKFIVDINSTIYNSIKKININSLKTLLVVENNKKFKGTITDGDIRRALLKGKNIKSKVSEIYNNRSKFILKNDIQKLNLSSFIKKSNYDLSPIMDNKKNLVDVLHRFKKTINKKEPKEKLRDCITVITAGGNGTRLSPFTKILPKPLVPLYGKPILEIIIEKFRSYNLSKFFLTTHYKSKIIEAYLKESYMAPIVKIVYEKEPLGTIGNLSNLKHINCKYIYVTTCDTLIDVNYNDLLNFHKINNNDMTIVVAKYNHSIPYGVCDIDKSNNLIEMLEKPKFTYMINTGLYLFNKKIIKTLKDNKQKDFDEFLKEQKDKNSKIGVYKISSNKIKDFGKLNDFKLK